MRRILKPILLAMVIIVAIPLADNTDTAVVAVIATAPDIIRGILIDAIIVIRDTIIIIIFIRSR